MTTPLEDFDFHIVQDTEKENYILKTQFTGKCKNNCTYFLSEINHY